MLNYGLSQKAQDVQQMKSHTEVDTTSTILYLTCCGQIYLWG